MTATALSTDLYEITMMAGYYLAGHNDRATFELFVRELPPRRQFLVAAGLAQALEYLERLRFTPDEIAFLRSTQSLRGVPTQFFDEYLPQFRFTGDVWAVPEGTPVFPMEPLLRVTAPVAEAQLVETALLAIITFQTSIASKAARIVEAAAGRLVMEFGSRRAHGIEAGVLAARAACVAGCHASSNVQAGFRFGIPVSGTMAHSWVMSFDNELAAFRAYAEVFGERAVFLIDTYDSIKAARLIVESGLRPAAVRLDSGDMVALAKAVRGILDDGGLGATRILASGNLDEDRIAAMLAEGAPIDGFGVGTALATSEDAPALGGIYKIVEVEREGRLVPVMKLSGGKRSYPGAKQVWRMPDEGEGGWDLIGLATESAAGRPLLAPVMRSGRRLDATPSIESLAAHCRRSVAELPASTRRLDGGGRYPVRLSAALQQLTARTESTLTGSR
jgi:nicotinate phosphoribosyltransferase